MEVEKAVILFYLGLAAAFCGAAGLVREENTITQSGFQIFVLVVAVKDDFLCICILLRPPSDQSAEIFVTITFKDLIRSATGVLGEYNLCR